MYSSENSTGFLYAPGGGKVALMAGQSLAFSMVPLPGGATAMYNSSGLWYYGHGDWEGSWRLASTPSRGVYGDLAYSPYGIAYAGSGPDVFTGQIVDTPDNLNDFPNRLLQTSMARWLSPDPAGTSAATPSDPQSWNRYAYVENEPLELTDPIGLDGCGGVSTPNGPIQVCHGTPPAGYDPLYSTPSDGMLFDSTDGNDIFDAIAGAPGTYLTIGENGSFTFGFSEELWSATVNVLDAIVPALNSIAQSGTGLSGGWSLGGIETVYIQDSGDAFGLIPDIASAQLDAHVLANMTKSVSLKNVKVQIASKEYDLSPYGNLFNLMAVWRSDPEAWGMLVGAVADQVPSAARVAPYLIYSGSQAGRVLEDLNGLVIQP